MKKMTLSEFVRLRYLPYVQRTLKPKTVAEYRRLLDKLILPEFGGRLLTSMTRPGMTRWHQALAADAPYQANRALAVLSGVLRQATETGYLDENPAAGMKYVKERNREAHLSKGQVKLLLELAGGLSPVEGSYLLVLLYTGARPGELVTARWEWLNEDCLELPDSKTGKRTVYLPHAALVALAPVHGPETGPIWPGVNPDALWKRVKRAAKGGLDGVRMYDLRHTFASTALSAGLPLETISQLLGHSDPRTTRRYTHLMKETGRAAVRDVAAAFKRG